MTTLQTRALAALSLGGCASQAVGADPRFAAPESPDTVLVDNQSRDRIDVYLVAETRERHLGHLEPDATAWLLLPTRSAAGDTHQLRLAVIAGARRSLRPSVDARAATTLAQPVDVLLGQTSIFAYGRLTGLRYPRTAPPRQLPPRSPGEAGGSRD